MRPALGREFASATRQQARRSRFRRYRQRRGRHRPPWPRLRSAATPTRKICSLRKTPRRIESVFKVARQGELAAPAAGPASPRRGSRREKPGSSSASSVAGARPDARPAAAPEPTIRRDPAQQLRIARETARTAARPRAVGQEAVELRESGVGIGGRGQRIEQRRHQPGQKFARPGTARGADAAVVPAADRAGDMMRIAEAHACSASPAFRDRPRRR